MSHVNEGRQPRALRSLVTALLGSVCLTLCFSAGAQAAPEQQPAAPAQPATAQDFTFGGWKYVPHRWPPYGEVLANKAMTRTIANVPSIAMYGCRALRAIPAAGTILSVYCSVHLFFARRKAQEALRNNRCFRFVIPGHRLDFTYPSTYSGDWCR